MEMCIDYDSMKRTSCFDLKLKSRWDQCEKAGLIKYSVKGIPTKIMGKLKFVVQGNFKRGELRRTPDEIISIRQPFDGNKFNFLKIGSAERLFYFSSTLELDCENKGQDHQVVINNCPIEDCSSLLLPFIHEELPQILTLDGIKLATELLMLSNSPSFKLTFNSLGGNCSVNHLHFQMYYLRNHLYLERAKLKNLCGPCWTVDDYPAKCFVFLMEDATKLGYIAEDILKLVNFFIDNNISHNLFITKGAGYEGSDDFDSHSYVRFILWARKFASGAKDEYEIVPAASELSGQLIIWTPEMFDRFQTNIIHEFYRKNCDAEFKIVQGHLEDIFF